jgi:hypothetical protein
MWGMLLGAIVGSAGGGGVMWGGDAPAIAGLEVLCNIVHAFQFPPGYVPGNFTVSGR